MLVFSKSILERKSHQRAWSQSCAYFLKIFKCFKEFCAREEDLLMKQISIFPHVSFTTFPVASLFVNPFSIYTNGFMVIKTSRVFAFSKEYLAPVDPVRSGLFSPDCKESFMKSSTFTKQKDILWDVLDQYKLFWPELAIIRKYPGHYLTGFHVIELLLSNRNVFSVYRVLIFNDVLYFMNDEAFISHLKLWIRDDFIKYQKKSCLIQYIMWI